MWAPQNGPPGPGGMMQRAKQKLLQRRPWAQPKPPGQEAGPQQAQMPPPGPGGPGVSWRQGGGFMGGLGPAARMGGQIFSRVPGGFGGDSPNWPLAGGFMGGQQPQPPQPQEMQQPKMPQPSQMKEPFPPQGGGRGGFAGGFF